MQPGAGYFTHRVKVGCAGTPPFVHRHASAEIVSSWNDGDELTGDVDAHTFALSVDIWEAGFDLGSGHVRGEVEQNVGVIVDSISV